MRTQLSFTAVLAATATLVAAAPTNKAKRHISFDWRWTKARGVNLGGWLVLEPFITPSIFEKHSEPHWVVEDEWSLCDKLGKQGCYDELKPHWETFAQLADFEKIRDAGLNVVRIPIGYWAYLDVGGPYPFGAADYLDKAVEWARQTGLKVIIDLHGAPGSQNGFDHSGQKRPSPGWGDGPTLGQTHAVLKSIEEKYAVPWMQDVVIAIQLLNEPFVPVLDEDMVKQFYRDGYYNLREISDTPLMLHDGFRGVEWLNDFLTPSDNGAYFVILDHHEYQIFGNDAMALSPAEHRTLACNSIGAYTNSDKWTIVGEWSAALTDCAPHLNGFRAGNRYEGSYWGSRSVGSCGGKSGNVSEWSHEWKDDTRKYIETQLDAFEANTDGWVFWNFKTEGGAGEWDLFQLLDNGVFPQPLGDRWFGEHCTNF
ncbi:glycoside hydrolase superfamily [Massariosphaeria phaeospora]|uniref:Glycoside hydrolase superfamily n=1 Tax=Massariosphaeria phaeospora TaxID=100035 RepID=A0A7C8IA64_9PLEO|nr:glycoside hydrolase superfamily [Massariosphaeria phaeospora]